MILMCTSCNFLVQDSRVQHLSYCTVLSEKSVGRQLPASHLAFHCSVLLLQPFHLLLNCSALTTHVHCTTCSQLLEGHLAQGKQERTLSAGLLCEKLRRPAAARTEQKNKTKPNKNEKTKQNRKTKNSPLQPPRPAAEGKGTNASVAWKPCFGFHHQTGRLTRLP